MKKNTRYLVHGALIAALYVTLTYMQNALLPGSASQAIQFRVSEALCVLALFTPAAIPGLTVGCLLFNISNGAIPLDFLIGSAASFLAAGAMYLTRNIKLRSYPLLSLLMPALFNGLLVGWELDYIIGGGFWFNGGCGYRRTGCAAEFGKCSVLFTEKIRKPSVWLIKLGIYGIIKLRM